MSTTYILVGLMPILLFAFADWKWGPKIAAVTAIVSTIFIFIYEYAQFKSLEGTLVAEGVLVTVLALVSLAKNDAMFVKLQPTVTGVALALFLAWFQFFDQPYLLKLLPRIQQVAPDFATVANQPAFRAMMARVSFQLIFLFLLHAAIMAYSALRQTRKAWVLWRLAIYPALLVLMVANQLA